MVLTKPERIAVGVKVDGQKYGDYNCSDYKSS